MGVYRDLFTKVPSTSVAVLAACGASVSTSGDVVTNQWQPTLQIEWAISGSGDGTLEVIADPLDDGRWQFTSVVGDDWRVLTWNIIVDITSGSPMLDIASLIAKNYTPDDAQFSLTIDLDLTEQPTPNHHLLGDIELILAGSNGVVWVPQDDQWLWTLRADGFDKGGIFENPWQLEVEQGAVMAFGGVDLQITTAPTMSLGFGLDLMLTAGEGAYINGIVSVPAPPTLLFVGTILFAPRRRR